MIIHFITLFQTNVMWKVFLLELVIAVIISYLWVRGIDNMQKNHPDYKGEDFLNWGDNDASDDNDAPKK